MEDIMKTLFLILLAVLVVGCSDNPVTNSVVQTDKPVVPAYPLVITLTDHNNNTASYGCYNVFYEPVEHGYILHIATEGCGLSFPIETIRDYAITPR